MDALHFGIRNGPFVPPGSLRSEHHRQNQAKQDSSECVHLPQNTTAESQLRGRGPLHGLLIHFGTRLRPMGVAMTWFSVSV